MTIYYKNSKLASLFNIIGCIIGICGIIAFIDMQEFSYLLVALCGFALLYLGNLHGSKIDFKVWYAGQNHKALEKKISSSITFAMEKYQECPNIYTYKYINQLNPEAGSYIKKDRAESGRKSILQGKKK